MCETTQRALTAAALAAARQEAVLANQARIAATRPSCSSKRQGAGMRAGGCLCDCSEAANKTGASLRDKSRSKSGRFGRASFVGGGRRGPRAARLPRSECGARPTGIDRNNGPLHSRASCLRWRRRGRRWSTTVKRTKRRRPRSGDYGRSSRGVPMPRRRPGVIKAGRVPEMEERIVAPSRGVDPALLPHAPLFGPPTALRTVARCQSEAAGG